MMTVNAPLKNAFSARTSVTISMIPQHPAAAKVGHIGKDGESQIWSNDVAQAQFTREVPQRIMEYIPRPRMPIPLHSLCTECFPRTGAF
jgi:hypothetical protein